MKITESLKRDVRAAIYGERLTEEELAAKLKRDPVHLSRVIKGSKPLTIATLAAIAEGTGFRIALVRPDGFHTIGSQRED